MFTVTNVSRFVLAAAIATACGVLLSSPSSCPPSRVELASPSTDYSSITAAAVAGSTHGDDLAAILRSAAMDDNTVIMTFTNGAMAAAGSLLDLFLESFRVGVRTEPLLNHLVIVAVDSNALELCTRVHPFCYRLDLGGGANFTAEKKFMTRDYLEMMWARNRFQTRVLELGYSFLFTDVDIVWFRNPLLQVSMGADITISCNEYSNGEEPYDLRKDANGGFLYAKANARTVGFFKGWYEAGRADPRLNEQDVINKVKQELSARHGAAVLFIDTAYFGTHCQPKKDFRRLCTFHANCLIGLAKKLDILRGIMGEWKHFRNTTILSR